MQGIQQFDLSGRVALVTGSSRGIGLALARGLGQAGATVVLNGRGRERLEDAAATLKESGIKLAVSSFDVTDPQLVDAGIADIERDVGPIEILVNNAGIQHRTRLDSFPDEKWRQLFATNVDSVFYVSRAVARGMIERGRGKIINIASVNAELARQTIAPYSATKGAIKQLTRGMAVDWGPLGLQANALAPGYFDTEMNQALVQDQTFSAWLSKRTPVGRWGRPEELIGAAVFLASDASSFVNGQILYVDGGLTATV